MEWVQSSLPLHNMVTAQYLLNTTGYRTKLSVWILPLILNSWSQSNSTSFTIGFRWLDFDLWAGEIMGFRFKWWNFLLWIDVIIGWHSFKSWEGLTFCLWEGYDSLRVRGGIVVGRILWLQDDDFLVCIPNIDWSPWVFKGFSNKIFQSILEGNGLSFLK